QRDDLLRGVISKRKKSVARHGWTVLSKADLAPSQKVEAEEHAAALSFFYNHLECEHAVDGAERGGFKLLARQMMDAVGKRFAVHELVWKECAGANLAHANGTSGANRNFVTAKFRFVPLGFFENTTGRIRFVEKEGALTGQELEPGAWMVTVGEGLMVASSTAWMFKHLSLDDWMRCSQRNGTPALRGISAAARDSAEWQALQQGIMGVLEGESLVHSSSDDVDVLNLMGGSIMPFPQLVERIDRMLAALWRGADLSTISRDRGYGASLQEKETCALEEDDAEMLTETLHRYVDQWVIRHVFGEGVRPLAGVKVLVSPRECTTGDLQIDEFLLRHGAPLSIQETMIRYGRALPKGGEKIFMVGAISPSQASLPESSQKSGMLMGHEHYRDRNLDNQGFGCGPSVSFRGCLPGEGATPHVVSYTEDEGLPNQFTVLQEEWVQLSPYGDFPHARGLQRVDRVAAELMVTQFHSFRGRVGRLFGGVPFYVGHPDLPASSELVDRKAYGWIMEVEAREDGFYGRVKWSEAGLALLRNAHFKFLSPFWEAREIGQESGRRIYRPVALISAGLTNQPNIPVKPLANTQTEGDPLIVGDDVRSLSPEAPTVAVRIENLAPPRGLEMHTVSCTENLGARRGELVRLQNRRDRIQECVLAKMRLGMSYDDAWENVKREHQGWFAGE
ncbi:MAG: phage portal protein family protein, partial [Limisphaerales bacterium]